MARTQQRVFPWPFPGLTSIRKAVTRACAAFCMPDMSRRNQVTCALANPTLRLLIGLGALWARVSALRAKVYLEVE